MFRTVDGSVPFVPLGGLPDPVANTVIRGGLIELRTLTLGDRLNPLPVTVASFDAKRVGANAEMTWQTASEQDNKGFNVQVSTDGQEFRTLGFVASAAINSSKAINYTYTDTEKNKTGLRYYRLQQVDLDGKTAFFTPRAVSFEGKVATAIANAQAYPNPFTSDLRLNLNSTVTGNGTVTVSDLQGRSLGTRNIAVAAGNNDIELLNMAELQGGIYMLRLTMPNGETKTLKVVKR